MTDRHTLTLSDGRVFEACSAEERRDMYPGDSFYLFDQWYRLQKREPISLDLVSEDDGAGCYVHAKVDCPVGTKFILAEVL